MTCPDAPDLAPLLDRYERPLVRYAQSLVGDVDSARDIVQETFIKLARGQEPALRGRDTEEGSGGDADREFLTANSRHLEGWLFTVTRHRALDHLRKFQRIIPMPQIDDRPCAAPGPAAALEQRESAASLSRLLDSLPTNQREVIRLKFQNDLSYREISEVTQLSVTNVGFLLHTGLKKLRALIAEQAPEDFGLPIRHTS